ncbi:hypothetical protein RclHR1_00770019 [Rhizophagus clarus]|uniref:Uncharacterized protein n=1 Tax=Rhizophagus clarus TaxID=94130 RepID=A0A2Z6RXT0_9GLOM|nr:hypothetical protein RclHR1_00770019 [Rhizophagus clarus]GES85609.1 hypothetical protein RCL_jg6609.t1 [Rhizophagus clarus]
MGQLGHAHKSNFNKTVGDEINHEQQATNQATNATQMVDTYSNVPYRNFSDATFYTIIRRRRNHRQLRHRIAINIDIYLNRLSIQNTNDPLINQFFNGIAFP